MGRASYWMISVAPRQWWHRHLFTTPGMTLQTSPVWPSTHWRLWEGLTQLQFDGRPHRALPNVTENQWETRWSWKTRWSAVRKSHVTEDWTRFIQALEKECQQRSLRCSNPSLQPFDVYAQLSIYLQLCSSCTNELRIWVLFVFTERIIKNEQKNSFSFLCMRPRQKR